MAEVNEQCQWEDAAPPTFQSSNSINQSWQTRVQIKELLSRTSKLIKTEKPLSEHEL